MKKWIKRVFLILVVMLVMFGVVSAYYTHGLTWSVDSYICGWLFRSMPQPPGFLPKTDFVNLTPYGVSFRSYRVEMEHAEAVDFFVTEFPQAGWDLVRREDEGVEDVSKITPGAYWKSTEMLFVYHQQYWLSVVVGNDVDKDGNQNDPFPIVMMVISTDREEVISRGGLYR